MTGAGEALHAAALALEEDIRKMDAGELRATPEQRAFLMGAKNALMQQKSRESGGYPVDDPAGGSKTAEKHATDGGWPENPALADV